MASQAQRKNIDAEEAVRAAVRYVERMYSKKAINNVALEEIEPAERGKEWRITVGFDRRRAPGEVEDVLGIPARPERVYKIVGVDAATGEVRFMRIRRP